MRKKNTKVAAFLYQPVRNISSKKDKSILTLSTSVFIILFLNLFSPFGIKNANSDIGFILIISCYGLMAGLILYLFEFRIKKYIAYLNTNTVKLYALIAWYTIVTLIISFANYGYYSFLKAAMDNGPYQFPPKSYLFFLFTTFLVAFVIGLGLALYFRSNHKRREIIHVKNIVASKRSGGSIQIWSENRKESFTVDLNNLLFLEKKDNYVLIYYEKERAVEKHLIRASLKEIEENYIKAPLTRCHLSYIVNLSKVDDYTGNSKGLKLMMKNTDRTVPVSTKYYQMIIEELSNISLSAPIPT
jgi:hypothetical protein